jgi:hypothetical protein
LINFLDQKDKIAICLIFGRHFGGGKGFLSHISAASSWLNFEQSHFLKFCCTHHKKSTQNARQKSRPIQENLNMFIRDN